jgi:pimeloyl-ACP methyl ester carboxylesterase
VGEFQADAGAALETLLARPEVTRAALLGHSLGAVGTILAAAADPKRVAALVSASAPADPRRLTRQTFRLARLPIPEPLATPLAWLTTRVYVRPRGHRVRALSASRAVALYPGPTLLVHGALDSVVPLGHFERLARFAHEARAERSARGGPIASLETMVIPEGHHSWLYEHEAYRRAVARFLTEALGGPLAPNDAADAAAAVEARRIPDPDESFAAVGAVAGNVRTMAEIVGVDRPITADAPEA